MVGNEVAVEVVDPDLAVEGDRFDVGADETMWDRVTRRRDPDGRQLVDLADLDPADPWAQHRQLAQQRSFLDEPVVGDRPDLRMPHGR